MNMRLHIDRLLELLFPPCCAACDRPLVQGERRICLFCNYHLPRTEMHRQQHHEAEQLFWGQVPIKHVLAYLYFDDASRVQQLIHQVKYFNQPKLAFGLGVEYGQILIDAKHPCTEADALVFVPMSTRKKRKRGYNQSERFAAGLSEAMGLPCVTDALVRKADQSSQVGKGRLERFDRLITSFSAQRNQLNEYKGKHLVLVDDVLTSGATIIACAQALRSHAVGQVSVIVLARKR